MNKHLKKQDQILIAIVCVVAAAGLIGSRMLASKPANLVKISVDGKEYETLRLDQDTELDIAGYNGGTNHLIIRDGKAQVTAASCPDKVCVHQGWIDTNGEIIACLPNKMIVHVISGE